MSKIYDDAYVVDHADSVELTQKVIAALEDSAGRLYNKYLYLGPHGAHAWEQVELAGSFTLKDQARKTLKAHFQNIINFIQSDGGMNLDIVSLGTGTGRDDEYILREICSKQSTNISLFAVDLGGDLLRRAIKDIRKSFWRSADMREKIALHAMCVDISKLSIYKRVLTADGGKKRRLFHLLGLTIGNNNEYEFLYQIAKSMQPGDYLLIDVDFCLDDEEWEATSTQSYVDTSWEVDQFVSTPLRTAVALARHREELQQELKFDGMFATPSGDHCDFLEPGSVRIVKKPIRVDEQLHIPLSQIPGALSLSRFYVPNKLFKDFDALDPVKYLRGKLCDFSNKYSSKKFAEWLNSHSADLGLEVFMPEDNIEAWGATGEDKHGQHLVLLKRAVTMRTPQIYKLCDEITNGLDELFQCYREKGVGKEAMNLISRFEKTEDTYSRLREKYNPDDFNLPQLAVARADESVAKHYLDMIKTLA
ncbi:MAG: L-histidine N(alpha)-methyltransferase [Candidatus Thiodiazotropha taylori]|nr:L-histidine N(alpha)-methyltransferase [Candidatus Thiodiazotropha taylori]